MNKNENKHMLFSASMKMADLILANYHLLSILPRFGIRLGFGEKSLAEVCQKNGINASFFLLVCNVHTFSEYLPEQAELNTLDVESLICYLQQSHQYYMKSKFVVIEQKLDAMRECCDHYHYQIIRSFFDEYKKEVIHHFKYEEELVFPYIEALVRNETEKGFHIHQFEENHSNIEDKLSDLKNIIIKYLPESCSSDERNNVLFEIFLFEEDLNKHALIENKILVPFVQEIEKSHE